MEHIAIVITQSYNLYIVCPEADRGRALTARVSGKLMHRWSCPADFPAVGDRVALDWDGRSDGAVIRSLLPRRSLLNRVGDPRTGQSQVIAANLDALLICTSLNQNYSLRRVERYLAAARAAEIAPVVVLTKADLCADAEQRRREAQAALPGVEVLLSGAPSAGRDAPATAAVGGMPGAGEGYAGDAGPEPPAGTAGERADFGKDAAMARQNGRNRRDGEALPSPEPLRMDAVPRIREMLAQGWFVAFAGSSGVGKSTLVNAVLGREQMATSAVRAADGKGRHTTTHRQLLFAEGGGAVIDTPGMRAFALDDADVESGFSRIAALAQGCRFSDCSHGAEPGCAVRRAVEAGELDAKQVESYRRLKEEEQRRARRKTGVRR